MTIDLLDRMATLADIYMDKADKIEVWSEDEIAKMGPNMRSVIISSSNRANYFAEKAKKILDRIDEANGVSHNE